ncbi:hypothetical protein BN7_4775 [Wickerhamomyces ciferrii]|uniref:Guanine-nucleotide exchange factor YEL1 n=1 Tax=Wickerhamomyces ciferrii (strain ATCC 14091 / BCRC 22168 / CBS 111 / JCM 3599 / NBRC 0793 / NRRL Y-1031 F-60-10) TaxID=1206466 RepID=K0KUT6_WICCF|nr:uncharacterized protein BN7_4775 [Wickerhamomyces ciferrii]CCH45194.1 hypothetical protein BN7_4775 [Wickerhamomyces ciferrii]
MQTVRTTPPTSPILKPSPNITNINEIFNSNSLMSNSTTSLLSKRLNYDVANDIITEEVEDDEDPLSSISPIILTKARSIAQEIYNQTYTKIAQDQYAAFLGTSKQESIATCIEFMSFFEPWPNSLIGSLRLLCSKLYLLGESTQIDQILEIFSKSWFKCNKDNYIGDYKAIHIVCFSLFILNSDLHNEQNLETKFTKSEFVENTIAAIEEDLTVKIYNYTTLESQLRIFYDSIESEQLEILKVPKKLNGRRNISNSSSNSSSASTKRVTSISNISIKSSRNSKRYSSIGSSIFIDRETTLTDSMDLNYEVDYKKDNTDDQLEKLGPPWLIEGLLKCETNHNLKQKRQNSKNWFFKLTHGNNIISSELDIYNVKDWKQNIVIISKGLLKQYSFGSSSDRKNFMKTKSDKYVNTVTTYNLYSAVASLVEDNVISNADNNANGVAWVLTVPNLLTDDSNNNKKSNNQKDQSNSSNSYSSSLNQDKKIVYYASSLEIAQSFIETCNFWAARITSIPTTEESIVTNAEYGWSDEILSRSKPINQVNNLQKWEKIISIESSFIPSSYELQEQFENLQKYINHLENLIDNHNGLKPILEKIWGNNEDLVDQYDLVISNWNEKYVYIYRQHQKFKTYLDSLAFALSFRATKI